MLLKCLNILLKCCKLVRLFQKAIFHVKALRNMIFVSNQVTEYLSCLGLSPIVYYFSIKSKYL